MPRKPRIHFPGAFFHVTHRGNNQEALFVDRADGGRYFGLLSEGVERFAFAAHALCLMTNHAHLLIQVGDTPVSKIMHNLSFRFAAGMNRKQHRSGHVFQGRFHARLVDSDDYLLAVLRYIHRNPIEAGLVRRADEYAWSSHRTYLGQPGMPWVTTRKLLGLLGRTSDEAGRAYRQLIDGSEDRSCVTAAFAHVDVAGDPAVWIALDSVAQECGISLRTLASGDSRDATEARALASHVCRELRICRLSALAQLFRRDASALRHGIRRLVTASARNPTQRDRIGRLLRRLAGI